MTGEIESTILESSERSGGPIAAVNAIRGMPLEAVQGPLSRLKNDAHASCCESQQPKPGGAGTIAGSDKDPGCVGGSLLSLDSNNFAQACGMRTEEISGGLSTADRVTTAVTGSVSLDSVHGTNGACAKLKAPTGMESEDGSEQGLDSCPGRTPVVLELEDGGVGEPPEEWRIAEANRRLEILTTFDALLLQGKSKAKAAKEVGQGYVTIWRWKDRFEAKGFNGLLPETDKCGRKTVWEKLGYTEEKFKALMEEIKGLNLDTNSTTASLRLFANSDRCPPELAQIILDPTRCSKHALPPSLRNAARVTSNERKAHEGPRALALRGAWTPRAMDILPGDVFTSDDTTPIWAWWVPWCESEEYPYGVKLMQGQLLPVIDVASQACITFVLIARESSSYRASDIWHLFGHTFANVGLPRLGWQLERGSWESNIVRGIEVEYRDREVTMSRRLGGLRQLPTNITDWHRQKLQGVEFPKTLQTWTSFLPKSKTIEAFFHRSQNLEGTLWGCLGRDQMRRPFEKAKKIYEACRRGAADPRLHFRSQDELLKQLSGIYDYLNHEPMEGDIFKGVPIQNFEQARKDYPLFQIEPELQWLYRRDWAVEQINGYFVRIRPTDPITGERYSLFYANPDVFARHPGEQVAVYYDRENFEQPAQIILASTGEFLCEATYEDRKGSFLSGDRSGHDMRKVWRNAVMSGYGTLVKHAPSRQVPAEIEQRRTEAKAPAVAGRPTAGTLTVDGPAVTGRPGTITVDGRPSAAVLPGTRSQGPTTEQIEKRRNRLAQEAALAARIRALRGDE